MPTTVPVLEPQKVVSCTVPGPKPGGTGSRDTNSNVRSVTANMSSIFLPVLRHKDFFG